MKKYTLVIESQYTEYDPVEEGYKIISFATPQELNEFLTWEVIRYKEHGYEYISIDVFDEFDNYITSEF